MVKQWNNLSAFTGLCVFDHFVGLALKDLSNHWSGIYTKFSKKTYISYPLIRTHMLGEDASVGKFMFKVWNKNTRLILAIIY